jgi:hypothetical protein
MNFWQFPLLKCQPENFTIQTGHDKLLAQLMAWRICATFFTANTDRHCEEGFSPTKQSQDIVGDCFATRYRSGSQ